MTDKRTQKRAEKKSETLEVRLPHSKKEAFKAACEDEGITASHAVRTFIDAYLKRSRRVKLKRIAEDITMKLFRNPLKTAGIAGTSILAAILFSASPSVAEDDLFTLLDANGDGFLAGDETSFLYDLQAEAKALLNNANLQENYAARGIILGKTTSYADYDTDNDGRFSKAEFSAIGGIQFEFDGHVDGHKLTMSDDVSTTITFFGSERNRDEAYYRAFLKSGDITFQSTETNEGGSTTMTIIEAGESEGKQP